MNPYFDCIVVGFGTAGSCAAIAAARMGAKVLALDPLTAPGGTFTFGTIAGCYDHESGKLLAELREPADDPDFMREECERMKFRFEKAALNAGVEIHYEAFPVAALKENGRVCGVEYIENGVHHKAYGHTILDGTAEGYFFKLAGAKLTFGRASDYLPQPFTNTTMFLHQKGTVHWNYDAGRLNPCCEESRTGILLETMVHYRQDDYGDLAAAIGPTALPGVREGGHIVPPGTQQSLKSFFDGVQPEEVLFHTVTNLDTHANDMPLESDAFLDWMIISSLWGFECTFAVERKVLFAADAPGVIAASRCLGVDHDLGHAVRMNGAMSKLGEIAGILAALAAKKNIPAEAVPYEDLKPYLHFNEADLKCNEAVTELDEKAIFAALDSDKPAPAMWSLRAHPERISDEELIEKMNQAPEKSMLKRHIALALVLRRNPAAVPELCKMVAERDPFRPAFSRKYNHARGYAALCGLGLLRDAGSVELIAGVLKEQNPGGLCYEYHTHAIGALLRIGEAHPETRDRIAELFRERGEAPAWYIEARLKGTENRMKRMDLIFRAAMAKALTRWGKPNRIREILESLNPDSFERMFLK